MPCAVQDRPAVRPPVSPSIDLSHELTKGFAHRFIRHKTRQLIGRYGFTPSDREEVDQELKLRLVERFRRFDPDRSEWPAFVTTVVERQVATLLEARQRLKRMAGGRAVSLSEDASDEDGLPVELADRVTQDHVDSLTLAFGRTDIDQSDLRADLAAVLESLPPDVRRICEALQDGGIAHAARRLGIPRTTLQSLVGRLRTVFEARGLHHFLAKRSSPQTPTR